MPGPAPKAAALRQRRNKSTSRAMLPAEAEPRNAAKKPSLPKCPNDGSWHNMARRWWSDVWSSPMSYEFLRGDEPALFRLVSLVDMYWKTMSMEIAREIRLMEREFGLTPLSRRRLEWNVAQAEEATDKLEERRVRKATTIDVDAGDVRDILDE